MKCHYHGNLHEAYNTIPVAEPLRHLCFAGYISQYILTEEYTILGLTEEHNHSWHLGQLRPDQPTDKYTWRKNGIVKEATVLQWVVRITSCAFKSGKSDGLVHCTMEKATVLCENHRERVMQIFWLSGNFLVRVLSRCFLVPLGVLFVTQRWTVGC